MNDLDVEASWATEPRFYQAPCPPPEVTGGRKPRLYQHAGVEYCLARDHAMIGDAPGLGKTLETVLLGNAIKAERTLVVCPASLRLNWEREVWRWSTIPNVLTYPILSSRDGVSPQAHYVIVSYDLLRNERILAALLSLRWDHMILDEGHYLKDPRGNKRTRAICAPGGLRSVVGRITLATGTPEPNSPVEVYNAIRLLNWDAIDRASLETFRGTYYTYGSGFATGWYETVDKRGHPVRKFGPHYSSRVRNVPTNLDDLRRRLRKHIMVRRLKSHVLRELPQREWHTFPMAITAGIRKVLRHPGWQRVTELWEMDPDNFARSIEVDGSISTARRLLGEEKAPLVADYVEELLSEGISKVIVAAWHHSVLDLLRKRLTKYGLVYMDGNTSPRAKDRAVERFQEDDSTRVILGQMGPLGEGWTLIAAQDVIVAEPHWVPGRNNQLLDRVHRFGQSGDLVLGHVPVVADTLDEKIMGTVIEKERAIYISLDAD